jgi:heme exporter protein A
MRAVALRHRSGLPPFRPIRYAETMSLSVADLDCTRAGRPVLRGVGFDLGQGEALLLRGPNGVGKSTLLRAIAGLLPTAGRIELDGVTPRDTDAWAERVALSGHLDAVKLQLTVAENLAFWAALLGGDAGRALAGFDLAPLADRPARLLSAGQRRRLGLGRLLLAPRRLWLLDEPTVGLDAAAVARLTDAVRAHCAAGGLAVIATHQPLELVAGELRLAPVSAAAGHAAADPFLAGTWT